MKLFRNLRKTSREFLFPKGRPQDYERISFADYDVLFHLGALQDNRGIGRMTGELLSALRKLAASPSEHHIGPRPEVAFFTTVHWCPPRLPARSVVYVLDVIPLLFPQLFPGAAKKWRKRYGPIAKQAALALGISQAGIDDAIRLIPLERNKTGMVPCGVSRLAERPTLTEGTPTAPYFCFLGTPSHHKNLTVALKALALLKEHDIQLRLIGNRHEDLIPLIRDLGLNGRIILCGRLDDSEAAAQLSGATALIFPSLYEGFGLPPLEAALLGVPSICSKRPAMTEFLADAALFCDPDSPEEWANAMLRLVSDVTLRNDLAAKAAVKATALTWDNAAKALTEHFARISREC